jgi:glyoxylase-like metal-dependent hydrolase (beta-lactamase superfamily II)
MRKTQLFVLMSVVGSAWPLSSYAATSPTSAAAETPRITVLYDAFGKDAAMSKDWGYAALVEINGKRILFDTGNDPAIFAKNVKAKGIDLTKLDFVVLSHRHTDHVSGVSYLLSRNPKVKIYAHGRTHAPEFSPAFFAKPWQLTAGKRRFASGGSRVVKRPIVYVPATTPSVGDRRRQHGPQLASHAPCRSAGMD